MKIYKTVLKYEIANENGWLGPFAALMQKAFICLLLYAGKNDTSFLQFVYSGSFNRVQQFLCILANWFT
jgi:hypothetical protein